MIEEFKKNIEQEKRILADMNSIYYQMTKSSEKEFYLHSLNSLMQQLKILNDAVPSILREIKLGAEEQKKLPVKKEEKEVVRFTYVSPSTKEKKFISINKSDKNKFLQELKISETGMLGLIKEKSKENVVTEKPSQIAKMSNKIFRRISDKLSPSFSDISEDLKKANMRFLISTYISIALFISSLVLVLGFIAFSILFIFNLISLTYLWIPFVLFFLSLVAFYFYPNSERSSVEKKITQELPFATIHMSAIAGSEIEPTQIFRIIASSPEYPNIGVEMRKLIVQVEVYGYNLVTSLREVAKQTSNKKLSELLSGIAINISTGGSLKNYLEKKAETFLNDYKLQGQKYSSIAGTFMDVYIALLIAAPLVLMLLLIIMNVVGLGIGNLSINVLMILSIGMVVLLNIVFLVVLQIKQPKI